MIRGRARAAVQQILETASFEVEDIGEAADLSAMRGDECLVVLCSNDRGEIEAFDRVKFQVQLEDGAQVCTKLLVTFNDSVETTRCARWGKRELAAYAGEAVVASILGEDLSIRLGAPGAAVAEEEEEVPAEPPGPTLPHLPIRITKERAGLLSGQEGTIMCRFIPHWYYHYVSSGEKVFRDKVISFDAEDVGAISAINGIATEMDAGTVVEAEIPAGSEVLAPVMDKSEARDKIVDEVIDLLTKGVRVKQVSGDAILSEDKILKPERKDVRVELALVYVPVWQIRGKKIVEINAHSGDVLKEPMDEGVELL
ncbi:MAG: hypothetical protein RQ758_04420 [Methanomicrobiaceae archaeon]|nr:hypothetical protein [Methanomicrobiaceae archaeon]